MAVVEIMSRLRNGNARNVLLAPKARIVKDFYYEEERSYLRTRDGISLRVSD
jgi:hypothetical protein